MSLTSDALRGVAQHLAAAGLGAWSTTIAYGPNDTAVVLKDLPDKPDRALAVVVYGLDLDVIDPAIGVRVQVTSRAPGPADAVDILGDSVIAVMHSLHRAAWGDLWVSRCVHVSTAPLGADEAGRHERSDNFRIITTRPGGSL